MSDYICKSCEHFLVCKHADNTITSCSQQLELVRCKDCKYGEYDYTDCFQYYECHYIGGDWNRGDHFCAYGERKDNGQT